MKFTSGIILLFFSFPVDAQLTGYVRDNYTQPVANANIRFVNEQDSTLKYSAVSDASGYYSVSLTSNADNLLKTELFQASPNPFYYQTEITFTLERSSRVLLSIYNLNGQRIRILESATLPADRYVYSWDGCLTTGTKAATGMYIIVLEAGGQKFTRKVVLVPYQQIASVGTTHELKSMSVNSYKISVTAENADTLLLRNVIIPGSNIMDFSLYRRAEIPFSAVGDYLGIWNGTGFDKLFLKGINLGVSVPGTQPGELAATREQYSRWIRMIGEAGFNSIRTYTLHYPRFYQELALYNNAHPDKPIYLFQGIWLHEGILNNNLYNYTDSFDIGVKEVIDCIHGRKVIGERYGKAFGKFDADVSRWVMGYILGREIYPEEINATDTSNVEKTSYEGSHFRINGSPTEVWMAERLDHLVAAEKNLYKVQRPVSFSSWPTLDPMEHPSEPDDLTDEDVFSFDLTRLNSFNAPAGYFASYHAYPYYPDFINRDPDYRNEHDEIGPNSYLGYLKHLKRHYAGIPLIIAEYGVPSSWGIAHQANSGMNHGGLTEEQQGEMNVRLLKNIHTAGCGGGMVFSWIDEWFKRTWLFDRIKSETERMPLWHSIASAEENFGLIAFEPPTPVFKTCKLNQNIMRIPSVSAAADPVYFRLKMELNAPMLSTDTIWIGIDTYDASTGESVLPNKATTSLRSEFALLVTSDSAKLYVTRDYDLFGIWFIRRNANPEQVFHSTVTDGAPWHLLRLKYNFEDTAFQKTGHLKVRKPGAAATSLDAVWFSGNEINIRIPWQYLNFTDPSARLVMNDDRSTPEREVALSDGIAMTISHKQESAMTGRFVWDIWNQVPVTTERIKPGLAIVARGNREISDNFSAKKKYQRKKLRHSDKYKAR